MLRFRPAGPTAAQELALEIALQYVLDLATGFEAIVRTQGFRRVLQRFHIVVAGDRFRGRVGPEFVRFARTASILGGVADFLLFLGGDLLLHYSANEGVLLVVLDEYDWGNLSWLIAQSGLKATWTHEIVHRQHTAIYRPARQDLTETAEQSSIQTQINNDRTILL